MFPDRSVNRSGDPELLAAAGKFFFISAVFLTAAILFLGLLIYTLFLRCPLMRHMSKKIMKGWLIQRVFMHSADILAFCGSPDFIFAWPDFWDPGRRWGILWSLSCGTYCTFFTRTGSCFRKHSVITERISRQLPFLIPDRNSTAACIKTWRKGGKRR